MNYFIQKKHDEENQDLTEKHEEEKESLSPKKATLDDNQSKKTDVCLFFLYSFKI